MEHSPGAVLRSVGAYSESPETLVRYVVDGITPRAVLFPASEAEVASALRAAAEEGTVVVPWGGGTKQDLGNPVERADYVLSLERLDQVVEYVPADTTITVQAGMPLAPLQALAARHGQVVPLDPPRAAQATIGGIVATAVSGPRRMAYGGVRDLVLGVRLALADGRVIKAGGKVVKNVAGYDMPKLAVGSLGTLGVITEVSLRLRPRSGDSRTLVFGFAELGEALAAGEAILNSELLPAAVTVLSAGASRRLGSPGAVSLAVALEETAENNAYQVNRLSQIVHAHAGARTLTGEAESDFWDRATNYGDRFGIPVRIRISTVISDLGKHLEGTEWDGIAHVPSGTVLLHGPLDGPGDARSAEAIAARLAEAHEAGASAVLESAPLEVRRRVSVWGPSRPEWKITHAIRKAFDPGRILNRGRYVGGV